MQKPTPRLVAVHDLSCIGRCSLTVIMPVLAALGVQVCPLPTAVLSTHLGGFREVAFCDFTDQMSKFYRHWQQEEISFDCIYSGFLASCAQIDTVLSFIDEFNENKPLVVVDPVMGDHGRLYSVYTPSMQEQMKKLVARADIITPNYTEACFLLGESYTAEGIDIDTARSWSRRLSEMGPGIVVITGLPTAADRIVNLAYERSTGKEWQTDNRYIPARYPGTGDIFASVIAGSLVQGRTMGVALKRAADFVGSCVARTHEAGTPSREGVLLERCLPLLWDEGN